MGIEPVKDGGKLAPCVKRHDCPTGYRILARLPSLDIAPAVCTHAEKGGKAALADTERRPCGFEFSGGHLPSLWR